MLKQNIIEELNHFIATVNKNRKNTKNLTTPSLIRISVHLLKDMPAVRDVIFEYFGLVADGTVQSFVEFEKNDKKGDSRQQPRTSSGPAGASSNSVNAGGGNGGEDDGGTNELEQQDCFTQIEQTLINILRSNPAIWSPIVASWSLDLIGSLAQNFSRHNYPLSLACNYWLRCTTMHCLLNLTCLSFNHLKTDDAEHYVDTLFNAYRKNATLNWVVARIGGSFPDQIISRLLQSSLKRYSDDYHCRIDSDTDILEYLCLVHEKFLQQIFKKFILDGFQPKRSLDALVIPFMLLIANVSDVLLQNVATAFVEIYNDEVLTNIIKKYPLWINNSTFAQYQPSLNNVILRLKRYGVHLLLIAGRLALQYSWCSDFLEYTLQELERVLLARHICPLMNDLISDNIQSMLWERCLSENICEQQTSIRLLLIASSHRSYIYYQTISELLRKDYTVNKTGFGSLIRLLMGFDGIVNFPGIRPGIQMVLEDIFLQEQFPSTRFCHQEDNQQPLNAIKNLNILITMQKTNTIPPSIRLNQLVSTLSDCLPKILQLFEVILSRLVLQMEYNANQVRNSEWNPIPNSFGKQNEMVTRKKLCLSNGNEKNCLEKWTVSDVDECNEVKSQLNEKDLQLVHVIVELLNAIEAGEKITILRTTEALKLSVLSVKYFFVILSIKESQERYASVNRIFTLLRRICRARKTSRNSCLRELIQGALFYYRHLFEQYEDLETDELCIPRKEMVLLQNLRQNLGPNSNRTALHAGVIGRGMRSDSGNNVKFCTSNEQQTLFIKSLDVCCSDTDQQAATEAYSTVSLLLVELVSPDVMYNGLPFPDEDFTKVTMERDLLIRRAFISTPLLWVILGFLAMHRPALCFLSVLLRALCATCLHQWRAKNVNKYQISDPNEELMECTRNVLQVLAMGQLIPPPLSYLHVVIEHFEPPEIALLLKECIWNYLKDHVPSPALFHVDANGLQWRNPQLTKAPAQYVDTLRNLMQKKLSKLGQHYYQMFTMPELQQQQQQQAALSSTMLTPSGIPMAIASCMPANNNKANFLGSSNLMGNPNMLMDGSNNSSNPERSNTVMIIDNDVAIVS